MGVLHLGDVIVLPAATELHWGQVMGAATNIWNFMSTCWKPERRLSYIDLGLLQDAWRKHNGLPEPDQCHRLAYMIDRYRKGVEFDLRNHLNLSLGELWRARRWRELLLYIDMLPANSHMQRLLTSDEEYMERVLTAKHAKGDDEKSGRPSQADWSMTNSLLATLVDAVNRNTQITVSAAGIKESLGLQPVPRPWSAAEKVNHRIQQQRHEEMVSKLLPSV
jgi:hypothetical protein